MAWQARFHITFTFCYKCLLLMLMLYLMMMMTLILFFDILGDMNGIAFLKCRSFERQICAKAIIFPILPANSIDATEKEFLLLSGPYCCLASKTKQRLQIKNINAHTHTHIHRMTITMMMIQNWLSTGAIFTVSSFLLLLNIFFLLGAYQESKWHDINRTSEKKKKWIEREKKCV